MVKWCLIVYSPAYNVAASVPELLSRMRKCAVELGRDGIAFGSLIIIQDGSTDSTAALLEAERARTPFLKVVHKKKNEGVVAAIMDGMRLALGAAASGPDDAIILRMDSDLEHQPEDIKNVLAPLLSGQAAVSVGYIQPDNRNGLFFRIFNERAGLEENRRFAGLDIPQFCPGFYAARADTLRKIFPRLEGTISSFRLRTGRDMVTLDLALFAFAKRSGLKLAAVQLRPIEEKWIKKQPLGKTFSYLRLHLETVQFLEKQFGQMP
jgi:glycosyltransferase involved in cell wall biosynthesis